MPRAHELEQARALADRSGRVRLVGVHSKRQTAGDDLREVPDLEQIARLRPQRDGVGRHGGSMGESGAAYRSCDRVC